MTSLLDPPPAGGGPPRPVTYRTLAATTALSIRDTVAFDDVGDWCDTVYAELHVTLTTADLSPTGADSALYYDDFFEAGHGQVVAYLPVAVDLPTCNEPPPAAPKPSSCPPPGSPSWCTTDPSTTSTRPTAPWAPSSPSDA